MTTLAKVSDAKPVVVADMAKKTVDSKPAPIIIRAKEVINMSTIVLSEVSGKIIGFELDDDGSATLKVKDENGKVLTTSAEFGDAPIPTGKVTIRTTIEMEGGKRDMGIKVNYLFGKNGKILIDPESDLPFPSRPGPQGRGDAAEKRLKVAEQKAGGRALAAKAKKLKVEFAASGLNPDQWNEKSH